MSIFSYRDTATDEVGYGFEITTTAQGVVGVGTADNMDGAVVMAIEGLQDVQWRDFKP